MSSIVYNSPNFSLGQVPTPAQWNGYFSGKVDANVDLGPVSATATGATSARTFAAHFADGLTPFDFGAVGNGITDDTSSVQAGLTYLGANGGGTLWVRGANLLCNSNISVPAGVTLRGDHDDPGGFDANRTFYGLASSITLGSGATINMDKNTAICGLYIIRAGLSLPAASDSAATTLLTQYSGTAITGAGADIGCFDLMLLGHTQGISITVDSNSIGGRSTFVNVKGDCTNGILITNSLDVCRIERCHFWPFLTVNVPSVSQANLKRSGIAYSVSGCDWPSFISSFAYGYSTNYSVSNTSNAGFSHCGSDSSSLNTYGWSISGTSDYTHLEGCMSTSSGIALNVNLSSAAGRVRTTGCSFNPGTIGIDVVAGALQSVNDIFSATGTAVVAASGTSGHIVGAHFLAGSTPWSFADAATSANWTTMGCSFYSGGSLPSQMPGQLSVGTNIMVGSNIYAGGSALALNTTAGNTRSLQFNTAGSQRWQIYADASSESGGDAGCNLLVVAFHDNGTAASTPISVTRSTGLVALGGGLSVTGGITGATLDGAVLGSITPAAATVTSGTASAGWHCGSQSASSVTDLTKHLDLYGGIAGINITSGQMNFSNGSTGLYNFLYNGSSMMQVLGNGITVAGAIAPKAPSTVTASTYTVASTDSSLILNPTAGQTLTLPTASGVNSGRLLHLKLIAAFTVTSASSNVVPLAGGAASTAILAATAGKWCVLQSDGSNWQIMSAN